MSSRFFGITNAFFAAVFRDTLLELTKLPLTIGLFASKTKIHRTNLPCDFSEIKFSLLVFRKRPALSGFSTSREKTQLWDETNSSYPPETRMAPEHVWLEY